MPGLIGYYPVTDNRFVALVRDGDAFALLDVEGCYPRLFVRISWDQALSGEPFNVDELLAAARRGAANHGPAANEEFGNTQPVETEAYRRVPAPPIATASRATPEEVGTRLCTPCPPGHTPMSEPHRALCQRYLKRLYRRLRGRGGRKARELVLILPEALEWCRRDITGTRQEVHGELERVLGGSCPAAIKGCPNHPNCFEVPRHFSTRFH